MPFKCDDATTAAQTVRVTVAERASTGSARTAVDGAVTDRCDCAITTVHPELVVGCAGRSATTVPPEPVEGCAGRSIHDLLLLVGDAEHGYKAEAMELLLEQGLEANYAVLEAAVRDDYNADLRNGAMEMLVKFGSESVRRLTGLLRDPNEEVRNFSAVMLGDIGSRHAVGSLIEALRDPDPNVGHGAAEALGKIGDRAALAPLIELLKGDLWVQFPAVTAMGALRDHRAVPHLLQLLDHEMLAMPAADALGKIGDPRALRALAAALPHNDDALAETCAKAMVAIHRKVNDQLNFKNSLADDGNPERLKGLVSQAGVEKLKSLLHKARSPESVEAAVALLGWLGELSAIEDMLALLADERYLPAVENAILSMGPAAEKELLASLYDRNDRVRIVALRSLRWLGAPCTAGDLARLLADANQAVLLEALETLKSFPQDSLLPQMFRLVEEGSDEASLKACEALGRFPFDQVSDFLSSLAKSHDPRRRRRCALLLGHLTEGGESGDLDALFGDEDAGVRREIAKAIGLRQLRAAIPLLRQALSDADEGVRETAVIAAADLGEPVLLQEILALLGSGSEALDYAVIRSVGMMGAPGAGAALVEYLGKGEVSRQVAYAVIETLGKVCYKEASGLVRSRYLNHADPDFRRLAVETLGNLGDEESLGGVEEAACDPHWSVRIAALHVLGKIGGARELPLLLEAMQDRDPMVRKHAIATLGKVRNTSTIHRLVEQLTDMEMSRHAFEALLKFGRSALPWLHRLVKKDYSVELRERVVDLIGKIGDRKSVEPLMELLEDPDPAIRLAAIDSLSYCFDGLPLKKLMQVRDADPSVEVQERAKLALRTIALERYS